jgi:CRP-like cAMP-binding protein
MVQSMLGFEAIELLQSARGEVKMPIRRKTGIGRLTEFRVPDWLSEITAGKTVLHVPKGETIFSQGEEADSVYFVQIGKVKICGLSATGKEAVLAICGARDFFGEESLGGQRLREDAAAALEPSTIVRIQKDIFYRELHKSRALCEKFLKALLKRTAGLKEDLSDQFFNHSRRRLARVLVKLGQLSSHASPHSVKLTRWTHEALAEMVGTTRSQVTRFMNEFRRRGLIDYNKGGLTIRPELLMHAVMHD